VSARAAAVEALKSLERVARGAPWAADALKLYRGPAPAGRPDPLVLKALQLLADRVVPLRGSGEPWASPLFRLFSEAFMLSSEFQGVFRRALSAVRPREGSAALELLPCAGVCLGQAAPQWGKAIAVDPSPLNLELVEERLRGAGVSSYELHVGGLREAARVVRDPVGLAIAASPSTWLLDVRELVGAAYSVLEPGGTLLLIAPVEEEGVGPLAPFVVALGGPVPPTAGGLEDLLLAEGFARVRWWRGELLAAVTAVKP